MFVDYTTTTIWLMISIQFEEAFKIKKKGGGETTRGCIETKAASPNSYNFLIPFSSFLFCF